jgi:2,4-dienoyl-CoA reductase-like NADH-dependent reductase (Old Yellow Enzyme family)/thioredoxin reductase
MAELPFLNLFSAIRIGPLTLKNRIVMPPMSTNFGDPQRPGFVSQRHKAYYGERAKGGAGLVIVEATASALSATSRKLGLGLYDDQFVPGLRELSDRIKAGGAASGIQIAPAGAGRIGALKVDASGRGEELSSGTEGYFAVSPLLHPMTGIVARELTRKQLEEIAIQLARAAERAGQAGFDVIEIHGTHGYLLAEFLSPYTNRRTDMYGGDIDGRSRFPLEVVARVREVMGTSRVLSYRMSATDFVEGGLSIADAVVFARKLQDAGVHIIHVSAGTNETPASMNRVIPPMSYPRGRLIPFAQKIKAAVSIPIIAVQRINTPELAEEVIRDGKADLVATGRALIADPHWPLKALEGRTDDIRKCIACNQGCMEQIVLGNTLTCLYNPEVGYEDMYGSEGKETRKKKILVVGAGPAGMEAAHVLAAKGYHVRLMEREGEPGGMALAASVLDDKREFGSVIEFLGRQLRKQKVEIEVGKNVDAAGIKDGHFDEIMVATGATPVMPVAVLRENRYRVYPAKDVVMCPEKVGENVFIIGGGSVGIEVAEHLHHLGKKVTVIEMQDAICADLGPLNRVDVLERVASSSITIMLHTKVLELSDHGIAVSKDEERILLDPPDTVVSAMGIRPNPLFLDSVGAPVHYVGDCRKVGNAMDAIHDAFRVAVTL